jgi:hypothetical protein
MDKVVIKITKASTAPAKNHGSEYILRGEGRGMPRRVAKKQMAMALGNVALLSGALPLCPTHNVNVDHLHALHQ